MSEKKCFKCNNVKALSEFYKHKQMADGHLNKCKECNKADTKTNRRDKVEYYREYDRARGNRQDKKYIAELRKKHPNQYRAQTMVNNAVRAKKLFAKPCEICSESKTHAHHDDYLEPLNVRWLCAAHHSQWHKENGDGLNK